MQTDQPRAPRWPRTQRFALSPFGRTVAAEYLAQITDARPGGRPAYDAARVMWARRFELQPDDGIYLTEVGSGTMTLSQLGEALAICSQSRDDVSRCVRRLVEAGLLKTVPAP